jgi:hypothetical protein
MPVVIHAAVAKADAILAGTDDPDCPSQVETPWGRAETARSQGEGVVFYATPSHGGFRLDVQRNERIPERWRNESRWYEEDWLATRSRISDCFASNMWRSTCEMTKPAVPPAVA